MRMSEAEERYLKWIDEDKWQVKEIIKPYIDELKEQQIILATKIIDWQKRYNTVVSELESISEVKTFHVSIDTVEKIISRLKLNVEEEGSDEWD